MIFFNNVIQGKVFLIIASVTILLSWLIPNHYVPWLTSHSEFFAFASLIILSVFIFKSISNICIPKKNILILSLILIPIVQFLMGKIFFWGDTFIVFIYLFGFFYAVCLGFNLYKQLFFKKNIYLIFYSIILFAAIISVFLAMKQWLLQSDGQLWLVDFPQNARPFANFAQPNTLATFLIMGLISLLYLFEKQKLNVISSSLMALLIIFGIALTQSRTSWIFALCFVVWWLWKTSAFQPRTSKKYLFLFVSFYILSILTLPTLSEFIGVNNTSDVFTRASTGSERLAMWKQMLIAIQNQPWVGYGWNQVSVAQVQTTLEYPVQVWTEHSHNILLDILVWNGIPIGITIIGFLCWWLYQLSKLATTIQPFIALSIVGAVLVHAMFEYPLEYAFFLLPVGFLLGLVQAEEQKISVVIVPKFFIIFTLISSIIFYIWIFLEYRIIEKDVQLARFESLNIGDVYAKKATPDVIFLTQLREQLRFVRTQPKEKMTAEQLEWMHNISYRYATQSALYKYAQALALNNQLELAKKQLLIIEKLHGKKISEQSLYIVNNSLSFKWDNNVNNQEY